MEENVYDKNYIKWNNSFAIGISVIDEQHKKLVLLCNNLYCELMNAKTETSFEYKEALAKSLHECVEYVKKHFHDEELLMQAANYSAFTTHKKYHEEFTKQVILTAQNFNSATFSSSIQFVKFLYDWILSHIAHEDKLYVKSVLEYYKNKKI